MRIAAAAGALGAAFGFAISWVHATDPNTIRAMLLLDDLYLFGVLGTSTVTAFLGMRVLRGLRARALVTREPVSWSATRPEWRHVYGSAVFGIGWGVANTCPGPVAAQLGQGALWSLLTISGVLIGIRLRTLTAPASARVATEAS